MPDLFDDIPEEKPKAAPKKKEAYRVMLRNPVIVEREADGKLFFYPAWDGKEKSLQIEEPAQAVDVSSVASRLTPDVIERQIILAGILKNEDLTPQSISRLAMGLARLLGE